MIGVPTLHEAFVGADARRCLGVDFRRRDELCDVPWLPVQFKRIRVDVKHVVQQMNGRAWSGAWRGGHSAAVAERTLGVWTPAVHPLVVAGVAQQGARPLVEIADLDLDRHPTGGQADAHRRGRGRDGVAAVAQTADRFVAPAGEAAVQDGTGGGLAHGEGGGTVGIVFVLQIDAKTWVGHEVVFRRPSPRRPAERHRFDPPLHPTPRQGADQSHGNCNWSQRSSSPTASRTGTPRKRPGADFRLPQHGGCTPKRRSGRCPQCPLSCQRTRRRRS